MKINDPRKIKLSDFPKTAELQSQIRFILRYAILAPSTHNSQPWLFKIMAQSCDIYYDPRMILPEADPKQRDLYISIGCVVENLILAAKHFNIFDSVSYGPFDDKNKLATVRFREGMDSNDGHERSLIDTITRRINARGLFSREQVPDNVIDSICLRVGQYFHNGINTHWVKDRAKISRLATLTAEGLKSAYRRPLFRQEMYRWMHNSMTKKKDGLPGYALRMPFLISFILPTLVRWFDIGAMLSLLNRKSMNSAPLISIITVNREDKNIWLEVGRLAERLMLEFNSLGWQTSVFVAAIEMGDFNKEVQEVIGTDQIPQFLFVVGKVDMLHKATPRHDITTKIIT